MGEQLMVQIEELEARSDLADYHRNDQWPAACSGQAHGLVILDLLPRTDLIAEHEQHRVGRLQLLAKPGQPVGPESVPCGRKIEIKARRARGQGITQSTRLVTVRCVIAYENPHKQLFLPLWKRA